MEQTEGTTALLTQLLLASNESKHKKILSKVATLNGLSMPVRSCINLLTALFKSELDMIGKFSRHKSKLRLNKFYWKEEEQEEQEEEQVEEGEVVEQEITQSKEDEPNKRKRKRKETVLKEDESMAETHSST